MDNRQSENTNAPKVKNITATARVFGALPNIWGNIAMLGNLLSVASEIKKYKKKLKYHIEGITLCRIGFMEIAGTNEEFLNDITLDLGVECLKSLSDILIDNNKAISQKQKQSNKDILHALFDRWKEETKEAFKKDGKWIGDEV